MDRINFIGSVSGIDYPQMIVTFFDHFIALKQLVEDFGKVNVLNSTEKSISFSIEFQDTLTMNNALAVINTLGGVIVIYERPIAINVDVLTDHSIIINLS